MPNGLDLFTIAFNSEGLKQFEEELKNNEKELDRYEKEVTKLENKLEELKNAQNPNIIKITETRAALENAKVEAERFGKAIKTMKGQSEYQLLQMKRNFGQLVKTVGLLAFVGATVRRSLDFYEQGEQLEFLAEKTGIAVEKLQLLGNATKRLGGTTEGTATSVENIRTNREEYAKAGIRIESTPEQTLENIEQIISSKQGF